MEGNSNEKSFSFGVNSLFDAPSRPAAGSTVTHERSAVEPKASYAAEHTAFPDESHETALRADRTALSEDETILTHQAGGLNVAAGVSAEAETYTSAFSYTPTSSSEQLPAVPTHANPPAEAKKQNKKQLIILSAIGAVVLLSLVLGLAPRGSSNSHNGGSTADWEDQQYGQSYSDSDMPEEGVAASDVNLEYESVLENASGTFVKYYLSYLNANNSGDISLLECCTDEMVQKADYKIATFNNGYIFENVSMSLDLDSFSYAETTYGYEVSFMIRCYNLCYRSSGSQASDNIATQSVRVLYYADSDAWLVDAAVVKKEYTVGNNLLELV